MSLGNLVWCLQRRTGVCTRVLLAFQLAVHVWEASRAMPGLSFLLRQTQHWLLHRHSSRGGRVRSVVDHRVQTTTGRPAGACTPCLWPAILSSERAINDDGTMSPTTFFHCVLLSSGHDQHHPGGCHPCRPANLHLGTVLVGPSAWITDGCYGGY